MTDSLHQATEQTVCTLPGLLVTTTWLTEHLHAPDLRVVDVRPADAFAEAHIPGAVQIDLAALATVVDGVQGMLIGPEAFAAIMGQLGIDENRAVVIYDSNWGMPAARVLWTLAYYGHSNAAVLNGGWDRWEEEGRAVSQATEPPEPTRFTPQPVPAYLAELSWLQTHLDDPNVVLIDTRTNNEYAAGHLPNAIAWDWMNGVPAQGWDTMRPAEELAAELAALGITPDKEIVTYCRSGARAAHTHLVLRKLGYPRVRNYDGSWLEWSARVLGITHS
ncbi:MAG: sulfurtransferase [Caldilineaceae bacterium]|nr:sulfurtransferase [Caldilineaceae bacterium]